jgi:hypothetical protein
MAVLFPNLGRHHYRQSHQHHYFFQLDPVHLYHRRHRDRRLW